MLEFKDFESTEAISLTALSSGGVNLKKCPLSNSGCCSSLSACEAKNTPSLCFSKEVLLFSSFVPSLLRQPFSVKRQKVSSGLPFTFVRYIKILEKIGKPNFLGKILPILNLMKSPCIFFQDRF